MKHNVSSGSCLCQCRLLSHPTIPTSFLYGILCCWFNSFCSRTCLLKGISSLSRILVSFDSLRAPSNSRAFFAKLNCYKVSLTELLFVIHACLGNLQVSVYENTPNAHVHSCVSVCCCMYVCCQINTGIYYIRNWFIIDLLLLCLFMSCHKKWLVYNNYRFLSPAEKSSEGQNHVSEPCHPDQKQWSLTFLVHTLSELQKLNISTKYLLSAVSVLKDLFWGTIGQTSVDFYNVLRRHCLYFR